MSIEAPGGVFWVRPVPPASTTGKYPDPEGRPIYVLTAHNPGGQIAADTANALAEKRLAAELERRGLTWWAAAGGDPSWTHVERGAAVIDADTDDVLALGAEFGQDAIFVRLYASVMAQRLEGGSSSRLAAARAERQHSSMSGRGMPHMEIGVMPTVIAPQTNSAIDSGSRPWSGSLRGVVNFLASCERNGIIRSCPMSRYGSAKNWVRS